MKIRSKVDVITNSSTEVFVLKDSRGEEEINKVLSSLGYKGKVTLFNEDLWSRSLEYSKKEDAEYDELLYTIANELKESIVDQKNKEQTEWYYMHFRYIMNPKELDAIPLFPGYEMYPDVEEYTDFQRKFTDELLLEEAKRIINEPGHPKYIIETFTRFIEDPETNFRHLYAGTVYYFGVGPDKINKWIEDNISLFPPYEKLLEMYDYLDINELLGRYIDFFADDTISPQKYLGEVYGNKNFNFFLRRLS